MTGDAGPNVRAFEASDIDQLVRLSLEAWQPVYASFEHVLGSRIYARLYPNWQRSQSAAVRALCADDAATVLVAEMGNSVIGFSGVLIHDAENRQGEIDMIAVAPSHQRRGVARRLIEASERIMQLRDCSLAVIATGGDEGHASARAAYASAGYTALPLVRYYKPL